MADERLTIRGTISETAASKIKLATVSISPTSLRLTLDSSRSAVGPDTHAVDPESVARVEFDNGFVLWTRADDLVSDFGQRTASRGVNDGSWELRPKPSLRTPSRTDRGVANIGIKLLEFFGVDLKKKSAFAIGQAIEVKQLAGSKPGLYRASMGDEFKLSTTPTRIPADKPLLIFLHGTASSTQGSFGGLWNDAANSSARDTRHALSEKYGENIFAFEHRSLTESPIQNVTDLILRLPNQAELHLVSHSRGGLLGELLCLAERNKTNDPLTNKVLDQLFETDRTVCEQLGLSKLQGKLKKDRDAAYQDDRKRLQNLIATLDKKQIRVRRFVRVACPARGTTLASGRLDRWLSVLQYVAGSGVLGDVMDFILAVIKERTDPRTLPGLEAMMPGSALTRLLNSPGLTTDSDLSVIAGDIQGATKWGEIKLLIADWFYGGEHDLVVNTGSMFGGIKRATGGARFQQDVGESVNHFRYFTNTNSTQWLRDALRRAQTDNAGFKPIEAARSEAPQWRSAIARSLAATSPRPIAVLLPGAMGSGLTVNGKRVWVDYLTLAKGGLADIRFDAKGVVADEVMDDFYGPLIEFLAQTHRVEPFAYDWRLSVRVEAQRLAGHLESFVTICESQKQPLHIVAHSMGGLLIRAMIADGGAGTAIWGRITTIQNSRLLMLGTPNNGSYEAMRWLVGGNPTEQKLALLDVTHGIDEIINIVCKFPGLVELLPSASESRFDDVAIWSDIKKRLESSWCVVDPSLLRDAKKTWDLLRGRAIDPQSMVYVAGSNPYTVTGYSMTKPSVLAQQGRIMMNYQCTNEGDGTVTWDSGRLPGVPMYYVPDTAHDELCSKDQDRKTFAGYLDLLMTGKTVRLSSTPPATSRGLTPDSKSFPLPIIPFTDDLPDEVSARGFGLGFGLDLHRQKATTRHMPGFEVSIRHGDLSYARFPIMVGHYQGDTIVSAEAVVDSRLGGTMSQRLSLGLYPGRSNSHAIFFNESEKRFPPAAVVVGLGQVGELSAGSLESSIYEALLEFALQSVHENRLLPTTSIEIMSLSISSLLIGTGAGGILIRDSIEAILGAALGANMRLLQSDLGRKIRIDQIEIVELYEDVAINAAEALADIVCSDRFAQTVVWKSQCVEAGESGLRQIRFDNAPDWWYRIEITEDDTTGQLRFVTAADRARAEVTNASGQIQIAESFIATACQSADANPDVTKTLFEMLIPNELKRAAPEKHDILLLIDERSARFPWELLENRWSVGSQPPAVAAGLLRQLKSEEYRATPAYSPYPTALVIGNPDLEGWSIFPDLPGARAEAQAVSKHLESSKYRVFECIDKRKTDVLAALHKDSWRILHLAGHGEHELIIEIPETPETPASSSGASSTATQKMEKRVVSGMIIGRNTVLTPGDIKQLRWVPELVFINCCHLGKTTDNFRTDRNRLAANLGVEFIRMGVKAVIAAGWAVSDGAASTFADVFYTNMLAGQCFGNAVRLAREATWSRHREANTWGAYQCYGDPSFRLLRDANMGRSRPQSKLRSPAELVVLINNFTAKIKAAQSAKEPIGDASTVHSKLEDFESRIPEQYREAWLARADVTSAIGFLWGEIRNFPEAIAYLTKALSAGDGSDCPLRAAEQLANFSVRAAIDKWTLLRNQQVRSPARGGNRHLSKNIKKQSANLMSTISSATQQLQQLCNTAPTVERLNLLGSAAKRLAWMADDRRERDAHLKEMANYYGQAFMFNNKKDIDAYPLSNWVTALALFNSPAEQRKAAIEKCRTSLPLFQNRAKEKPTFWNSTAEPDCRLAVMLCDSPRRSVKDLDNEAAEIVHLYRNAIDRGASPREVGSVIEHIEFLMEVARPAKGKNDVRKQISSILTALKPVRPKK